MVRVEKERATRDTPAALSQIEGCSWNRKESESWKVGPPYDDRATPTTPQAVSVTKSYYNVFRRSKCITSIDVAMER